MCVTTFFWSLSIACTSLIAVSLSAYMLSYNTTLSTYLALDIGGLVLVVVCVHADLNLLDEGVAGGRLGLGLRLGPGGYPTSHSGRAYRWSLAGALRRSWPHAGRLPQVHLQTAGALPAASLSSCFHLPGDSY